MGRILGIDLGTTNSCMAVMEEGRVVVIPNAEGERLTPSVVAFAKTGERMVGQIAKRQAAINPLRTISSVKRDMGSERRIDIDDRHYTPQEISAMILRKLKTDAEAVLGEEVSEAVITVPAYFTELQRRATEEAGRIAGLYVLRLLDEPTSAAIAYGIDPKESERILVCDLGGGTFDVSLLEVGGGAIRVLATAGNGHLGGDDFDRCIAEKLIEDFRREQHIDLSKDHAAMQRLREAAEKAKRELSTLSVTKISLPYIAAGAEGPLHLDCSFSRREFELLTAPLVEAATEPVRRVRENTAHIPQVSRLILVGGSTRIPAVREAICDCTGLEPYCGAEADECVAVGACLFGERCRRS